MRMEKNRPRKKNHAREGDEKNPPPLSDETIPPPTKLHTPENPMVRP